MLFRLKSYRNGHKHEKLDFEINDPSEIDAAIQEVLCFLSDEFFEVFEEGEDDDGSDDE